MAADEHDDRAVIRAALLAEARRLQKRYEAIRRRLAIIRSIMRLACRAAPPDGRRPGP